MTQANQQATETMQAIAAHAVALVTATHPDSRHINDINALQLISSLARLGRQYADQISQQTALLQSQNDTHETAKPLVRTSVLGILPYRAHSSTAQPEHAKNEQKPNRFDGVAVSRIGVLLAQQGLITPAEALRPEGQALPNFVRSFNQHKRQNPLCAQGSTAQ